MNRVKSRATAQLVCLMMVACLAARPACAQEAGTQEAEGAAADQGRQLFEGQVAGILARHCLECHDTGSRKGRLDLSRKDSALTGGESGTAIVPGKAEESLLWHYIESDMMPKDRPPLPDEDKRLVRQWIEAGATWPVDVIDPSDYLGDRSAGENMPRRLTVTEYIETVRSAVGVDVGDEAVRILPRDLRADGFTNTAYSLQVDLAHVEAYARLAEIIVNRMDVAAFAGEFTQRQELNDECMRELITGMGKWLLRGPLAEQEVAAFLRVSQAVAQEGGDFAEAAGYLIEAMLQSPRFLYRIEQGSGEGPARRVGDYELASRLSYIIWGGPPDRELMRAADAGELADRSRVEAQVKRMLEDPRAVTRSQRFIHEWMDLDRLSYLRPNRQQYPNWNDRLAADMREETLAFFKEVVWEQDRPVWELLNAQVTFATPRLADHYGLLGRHEEGEGRMARPQRVTDGLQALYTFEEASGEVVRDVSGAGAGIDLLIADSSAVAWSEAGLDIQKPTLIGSESPPSRLIDAIRTSGAITLEAWVTPADTSQKGPARIVTLSGSPVLRNFTLGQEQDRYEVRLRTSGTNANGLPGLESPAGSAVAGPTHVVYTRDAQGKAKLYIQGEEKAAGEIGGELSAWDGGLRLALGNELSMDRPWQGTLHLVAIYHRALDAGEVGQNLAAGARRDQASGLAQARFGVDRRESALQALYRFDEGEGNLVRDASGASEPIDLTIQDSSAVEWQATGLAVKAPTLIASAGPAKRLIQAVGASKAITIEAWVTPGDMAQGGPARIVTLSSGTGTRNFTLGQEADHYEVRLRASGTDGNGLPGLNSPGGLAANKPAHVVFVRDAAGKAKLYIDGEEKAAGEGGGELSGWDEGFPLALANETTLDRAWLGTLHLVAIYSRALEPEEIALQGSGLARYELSEVEGRGGLLTQGSVLTIGGDEASMVARGLFVFRELLYSRVEDPPPCVDTTPVPARPGLSQRAIAMERIANQSCTGCHSKFEPLAFGLEKFDGIGGYHEVDEHGNELRDDGEVVFPGEEASAGYDSSEELMDLLASSERVRKGITRKVTQFALGRPLVEADEGILDAIHARAREGGGTYASLITAIVMSDLVQMTRSESAP